MPRPKDSFTDATDEGTTDLATIAGGELSDDVLGFLSDEASGESGRIASAGADWISIQGGVFAFEGRELADPMSMLVVDFAYDNSWYKEPFDPKNPTSPGCFALSREPDALRPHVGAKDPQGDDDGNCFGCLMNAFGSRGKGKACKNSIRLALVPPDTMAKGDPQVYLLRLPPTAMKPYLQYLRNVNGAMKRPIWSVVTDWTMVKKGTYSIPVPKLNTEINNKDFLMAIKNYREKLGDLIIDPAAYLIDREGDDDRAAQARERTKVQ